MDQNQTHHSWTTKYSELESIRNVSVFISVHNADGVLCWFWSQLNFRFHNNTNATESTRSDRLPSTLGTGLSVRVHGARQHFSRDPEVHNRTTGMNPVWTAPAVQGKSKRAELTRRASFQRDFFNARRVVCGSVHDVGKVSLFIPEQLKPSLSVRNSAFFF